MHNTSATVHNSASPNTIPAPASMYIIRIMFSVDEIAVYR